MKKKILLSGLILFMVFGSVGLVSCGGDGGDGGNGNNSSKVVAAEYRGEFWAESRSGGLYSKAIISENEILVTVNYVSEDTDITTLDSNFIERETVWTEERDGIIILTNTNKRIIGSFEDNDTLGLNIGPSQNIYIRK